jgi:hypothetical protein
MPQLSWNATFFGTVASRFTCVVFPMSHASPNGVRLFEAVSGQLACLFSLLLCSENDSYVDSFIKRPMADDLYIAANIQCVVTEVNNTKSFGRILYLNDVTLKN